MYDYTREEWREVLAALAEPFDPRHIKFKPKDFGKAKAGGPVEVVAYVDARAVQDRLDQVCPGNWGFDWEPLATDAKGEVLAAKGTITIGGISRSDFGNASNIEPGMGSVSSVFKRTAVQWGPARYLYSLGTLYAKFQQGGRVVDGEYDRLRAKLPKPSRKLESLAPAPDDDEPAQAERAEESSQAPQAATPAPREAGTDRGAEKPPIRMMTPEQRERITNGCKLVGQAVPTDLEEYTYTRAQAKINQLTHLWQQQQSKAAATATPVGAAS